MHNKLHAFDIMLRLPYMFLEEIWPSTTKGIRQTDIIANWIIFIMPCLICLLWCCLMVLDVFCGCLECFYINRSTNSDQYFKEAQVWRTCNVNELKFLTKNKPRLLIAPNATYITANIYHLMASCMNYVYIQKRNSTEALKNNFIYFPTDRFVVSHSLIL